MNVQNKKDETYEFTDCTILSEIIAVAVMEPMTQVNHHSETMKTKDQETITMDFYSTAKSNFSIFNHYLSDLKMGPFEILYLNHNKIRIII